MKKKSVRIFSKAMFSLYCRENKINDSNVDSYNWAFIEILDTSKSINPKLEHSNGFNASVFKRKHSNVIKLCFDDLEKDIFDKGHLYKCMSQYQGKKIINFIKNNIDKNKFIIHCAAGISRSGAVGNFIVDYLKSMNYKVYFPEHNCICPNAHVSRVLNNLINNYGK